MMQVSRRYGLCEAILTVSAIGLCGHATLAGEIIVPDQMPLSVAIASAVDGDVITIKPAGSPYQQFPGISWSGKALTLRGSTGNPEDVVIDGSDLDEVLTIGAGAGGSVIEDLTVQRGYTNVVNNSSAIVGAGINLISVGGDVTVRNCIFQQNICDVGPVNARGAAIGSNAANVVLDGCVFDDNHVLGAGSDGGAVWLYTGTHLITGCTFSNNSAVDTAGGLRLDATVTQIVDCRFEGNTCDGWGGAIWTRTGDVTVIDSSRFIDNQAATGGAIDTWSDSGSMTVRNCLFLGNHATGTGGATNTRQPFFAFNCTLIDNTSAGSRQSVGADSGSEVDVHNCVIWNTVPAGDHVLPGADVRYSIVQGGYSGAGNLDVGPQLDADFMPAAGSPVIDAGDTTLYAGPLVELAGGVRGADDPDTADAGFAVIGPVIDMGAFELQVGGAADPCPADINGDGVIDTTDLLALLGAWGLCP
jgi:hypothetical protein